MEWYGAVVGTASLAFALVLGVREILAARATRMKHQISQVAVNAEFIGHEGDHPVCRAVCHNGPDHAITDVQATIPWEALMNPARR